MLNGKVGAVQIYLPSRSFLKKKDLLLEHSRKEVSKSNKSIIINHNLTSNINKKSSVANDITGLMSV